MQVFKATQKDRPALAALINSAYRGDASRAGWTTEADYFGGLRTSESELAGMPGEFLMANDAGGPIACVYLLTPFEETGCYLGMLTVSPSAQARGLGRILLTAAEAHARAKGARHMSLRVLSPREELMAWYERRGYTRTGETAPFPYEKAAAEKPLRMDMVFILFRKEL